MTDKKIEVTLVKSTIACLAVHKATVKALGLHRVGETVVLSDNDATRGMIFRVKHLVQVKEI
ncbi:MAG: 50S ribosomal protein L30 [Clostridia bacterium]|nr:50S ribosomal protein L30 [Clostridia bacterium]